MRGPRRNSQRSGIKLPEVNQAIAGTTSLPAPIGGWNAKDALAAMPPTDAVILDNFYPGTATVDLRPGMSVWAQGMPSPIKTIFTYDSTVEHKLFAAVDTGVYDVSSFGAVGPVSTALTQGKVRTLNFSNSGGSFLVLVNGQDSMKVYDGVTWKTIDAVSVPPLTGINSSQFNNIILFKHRLWFVENNSMDVWYLDTDAFAGVAHKFPMGPIFNKGGHIVAQANWTVDGGQGSDDLLVTVTSQGQLAVYQGTDPASADTFALVGVYYVGSPIGQNCFLKYGGDLLYISQQGIFLLSKLLLSATIDRTAAVSYKIDGAIRQATELYGQNYGWEATLYDNVNALIVNVPIFENAQSIQFVMNNITKSWCRFTGWNASGFATFGNGLYAAIGASVYKMWSGVSDAGLEITGRVQQAYTNFRLAYQKSVSLVRPNFTLLGDAQVSLSFDTDFKVFPAKSIVTFTPDSSIDLWDIGLWDEALWDHGTGVISGTWLTIPNNPGYFHSFRLQLTTSSSTFSWTSNDYALMRAGIL